MADDNKPDAATVRAVLREHGVDVPDRGVLSADHRAAYERLRQDGGGYDGGVTAADFSRTDTDDEPGPDMTETTPRGRKATTTKERRSKGAAGVRGLWNKAKATGKTTGKGKGHKWVSTSEVIEDFWGQLAWAARPIPPLARILACQAPTAGILLEDAARDTLVDRVVLQPVARANERFQAASAMLGPPVFTTMIALFGGAATDPAGVPLVDQDGMYVFDNRTQPLVAGLRFSLMSWLRVGGKKAEDVIEAAEESERLSDEADKLIRFILAPPEHGNWKNEAANAATMGREFLQARDTRPEAAEPDGFRNASQDEVTGALEVLAGSSSAFRPAPATGSKS